MPRFRRHEIKWLGHVGILTDVLHKYGALFFCIAMNVAGESLQDIEKHKQMQCEGITKHLTDEHHPNMVKQLWALRTQLEGMPLQLYLQSVAMRELVCCSIEESAIYYSQRLPKEIARFEWVIDAKDPKKVSTQERWWKETLGPLAERRSERYPFKAVRGSEFQYKHFNRSFKRVFQQWRPDGPRRRVVGFDIKAMLLKHLEFVDSRQSTMLQAADILVGFMRRTLNGEIKDAETHRELGRLQIPQNQNGTVQPFRFISLSNAPGRYRYPKGMLTEMTRSGRSMLAR